MTLRKDTDPINKSHQSLHANSSRFAVQMTLRKIPLPQTRLQHANSSRLAVQMTLRKIPLPQARLQGGSVSSNRSQTQPAEAFLALIFGEDFWSRRLEQITGAQGPWSRKKKRSQSTGKAQLMSGDDFWSRQLEKKTGEENWSRKLEQKTGAIDGATEVRWRPISYLERRTAEVRAGT